MTKATLKSLFGDIFEGKVGDQIFVPRSPTEFTPTVDPDYVFELDDIKLLLMWDSQRVKFNKNVMITGPTGSGKTQLIFQFAARTGREVFRYSCHERTDFAELVGTLVIKSDGSTEFQAGPLMMAMKRGAIFLLDEVNAARPGTLIGMNGVLDGAESVTLPGASELVRRHPEFRVAMTGNSMSRDDTASAFRGTQSMNVAFMDRTFGIEKSYLQPLVEAKALQAYLEKTVADPMLNPNGTKVPVGFTMKLVTFAGDVRQQFNRGECDITISTRGLYAFLEMLAMRWSKLEGSAAQDQLGFCAKAALLVKAPEPMRTALQKAFVATVASSVLFGAQVAQAVQPQTTVSATTVKFLLNPDRHRSGNMAFWGYERTLSGVGKTFYGMATGSSRITVGKKTIPMSEAMTKADEKRNTRGYVVNADVEIPGGAQALQARFADLCNVLEVNTLSFQANIPMDKKDTMLKRALKAVFQTP